MAIKMFFGRKLYNIISAYVPQIGRSEEEKDIFWDSLLGVTSKLANEERIILAGYLNGHVGASSEGYERVHGGFSYGMRNLEGERILDFSDATDMIICNTMFKKESEKLMNYKSGSTKSAVDYLLLRRCDRCIVKNVKVIPGEECINQHRLVVGDLTLKGARVTKRKFVPRLKVWKLKEENARRQFNMTLAIREEAMSMAKRNAKKLIAMAQEEKRHEFAKEMECADGIRNMVRTDVKKEAGCDGC
ncbi:craniofacial development protein 2-like [Gordionus sp. m RMFG-2023]|uniref:craniofacial development protein 2-like n=1 Tax=Gordionus sp. m RMFG-2023 TaxID=3053472 RepID=UPI0031FCA894